jgi:lipid II:glycine glycyltransferase (peptidoglycan interpeptide bridge formation enzyme)
MEACIITDRQLWNDFVASSVYCNITQSYEWGKLVPYLGDETLRVGVVDAEGRLCAAMLILIAHAPFLHQPYFYAPRGPIIDDPNSPAMTVLLNFVKAEARKRNAFMLSIEPGAADGDAVWLSALHHHGFHPTPFAKHIRHEWVLDISGDEKAILAGMKEKWRYNIRLAGRKGITVRRATEQADIDAFYKLYITTSNRDQFFIHPQAFYEKILRLFDEDGRDHAALFLAEYEGKPIAGTIILWLGPWSWYMYGASANEQRERMPNHLLQWTSMQWAKSKGCHYYNFRGIPDMLEEGQELWGVYVFKRGFGGYAMRSLETHELVYNPLVYQVYHKLLEVKRWRDERRNKHRA